MHCPSCGASNPDEAKFCKNCGKPVPAQQPSFPGQAPQHGPAAVTVQPKPQGREEPWYYTLWFNIILLALGFCCCPLAIIPAVFLYRQNPLATEQNKKTFTIIAIVEGAVVVLIGIAVFFLGFIGKLTRGY